MKWWGRPSTLDLLDISVERNAFGAQVNSFEDEIPIKDFTEPVTGVFIRAPVVTRMEKAWTPSPFMKARSLPFAKGNVLEPVSTPS